MSKLIHIDAEYKQWIQSLSKRYRQSQIKASVHVNREMLAYYWELGRDIVELHAEQRWGNGFMRSLSQDLKQELPDATGLTQSNLYYCKKFYLLYNEGYIKFPQVVGKLENVDEKQIVPQVEGQLQDAILPQVLGKKGSEMTPKSYECRFQRFQSTLQIFSARENLIRIKLFPFWKILLQTARNIARCG